MLGIVIATHGTLSNGLKDAAEVIIGQTQNIETVNLLAGEEIQVLGQTIKEAILKVNQGDGVVVLVDLVSASPYNQSLLATASLDEGLKENVYVIGGASLPVLLETINGQILNTSIHELGENVVKQGRECVGCWHILQEVDNIEEDDF